VSSVTYCSIVGSSIKLVEGHDSCRFAGRNTIVLLFRTYREVVQMNRKGFTLIELLIVVVIIGILAAIANSKFPNTKEKAYLASMKSDLRNLVTPKRRISPTR